MPKARRCGAIDWAVSDMMTPAGAAPIGPNARLTAMAHSECCSNSSDTMPTATHAHTTVACRPVRSAMRPAAVTEKIITQLATLITDAACVAP